VIAKFLPLALAFDTRPEFSWIEVKANPA